MDFSGDKEVLGTFVEETGERLAVIEAGLLELERSAPDFDPEGVHAMFRAAHSIKSGSNLLGLEAIERTAHRLEDLLQNIRRGDAGVDEGAVSEMLSGVDDIRSLALLVAGEELEGEDVNLSGLRSLGR